MANDPLQVRLYGEEVGDYQLVSAWWRERNGDDLMETLLPPIGVIVERGEDALGALWCYECFGVGVCFLEYPVTKPGISGGLGLRVMRLALEACIKLAKSHGDFSLFRCSTLESIAPVLPRLGFVPEGGARFNFCLRRD